MTKTLKFLALSLFSVMLARLVGHLIAELLLLHATTTNDILHAYFWEGAVSALVYVWLVFFANKVTK